MLGALPLEAVRQEHHDAGEPVPLVLGAHDELVDHDLRDVHEVAKLRLPHHEAIRAVEAVAVFESQHAHFREWAVVDLDRGLVRRQVLQRAVGVVGHHVMDHGMAMAERAALAVLARQPHPHALRGKARQRQRLGGRPVERLPSPRHLLTALEKLLNLGVRLKTLRKRHETVEQVLEHLPTNARIHIGGLPLTTADVEGPHAAHVAAVHVVVTLGDRQFRIESGPMLLGDLHRLFTGDLAKLQEFFQIALMHARPPLDHAIQRRLRERRLIGLVVATAAEAVHVDDDVALELAAEIHGKVHHLRHGFRILAIHMKDRNLQHLRHVGGIHARPRLPRPGGEADLVVDHHVKRAAGAVGLQFAQVQRLLDDPLAREGCVAVNQDHHAFLAGLVRGPVLPGPHAADRHRIHKFQMARVEAEREVHAAAVGGAVVGGVTEVILHVATAHVQLRIHVGKLTEDPLRTLPHDVREHVETAAMRHRQHDVADILRCSPFDRHLHQRDQTLRSLQREALGTEKPLLDELLEDRRGRHLPVDPQLLLAIELDAILTPLHPHLQPLPHPQVVHVHELHADRPAVGVAEPLDDLPQRHRLRPLDRVGGERPIHVGFGEVVKLRIEFR